MPTPIYRIDGEFLKRVVAKGGPCDGETFVCEPDEKEVVAVTEWGNAGKWNETYQVEHLYQEIENSIQFVEGKGNDGWARVFKFVKTEAVVKRCSLFDKIPAAIEFEFPPKS